MSGVLPNAVDESILAVFAEFETHIVKLNLTPSTDKRPEQIVTILSEVLPPDDEKIEVVPTIPKTEEMVFGVKCFFF